MEGSRAALCSHSSCRPATRLCTATQNPAPHSPYLCKGAPPCCALVIGFQKTGLCPSLLPKAGMCNAGCSVSWSVDICISPWMKSLQMFLASVPGFGHLHGNSFLLILSCTTLPNHPHCLLSPHGAPLRRLYIFSVPSQQVVEGSNKISPLPSLLQAKQTHPF